MLYSYIILIIYEINKLVQNKTGELKMERQSLKEELKGMMLAGEFNSTTDEKLYFFIEETLKYVFYLKLKTKFIELMILLKNYILNLNF